MRGVNADAHRECSVSRPVPETCEEDKERVDLLALNSPQRR